MGQIKPPTDVMLIVAVCSRYDAALQWAHQRLAQSWGDDLLASDPFEFVETDYYTNTMGTDLRKQFLASCRLMDPGRLPQIKHRTNRWEEEYTAEASHIESRPLNLDPGYLSESKLVLASTKDHAHRIYLADGIYAELTLSYRSRQWQVWPWTYPDYRREDYQAFFTRCRQQLRATRGR